MVMAGGDQHFCLRWNNHQTTLTSIFGELLDAEELFDCKIAAEGRSIRAHRILLSACSPYFKALLSEHAEGNPIFILRDVKYKELCALMDYMYKGQVNISQDDLAELLKVAESLEIRGLSDTADKTDERHAQKQVAAPQPQPTVPLSGLTIQHRPTNYHSTDLQADRLLTPTDSPEPRRKRKRARRRSSDVESGIGKSQKTKEHISSSNDSTTVMQPLPRVLVTSTPSLKNTAVIPETQTMLERPLVPDPPAIPAILPKTELPIEQVLIPKQEIEDMANEIDYEDLTMDDNDMDGSQPGPSHGSEGSSNQGYPPWQMGADGSVDEDTMRAQEAAGGSRDAQDTFFFPFQEYHCQQNMTNNTSKGCAYVEKPVAGANRRKPHVPLEVRYQGKEHQPLRGTSRRCAICSTKAFPVRTQWQCATCLVPLCLSKRNDCFRHFHDINWQPC